jgi:hypothetical protein
MHALESFDRFDFDDDDSLYENIDSVPAIQPLSLVRDWQGLLSLDIETPAEKFEA